MTLEEIKQTEWYQERPDIIKQAIDKFPPIQLYKFKDSGKQCEIHSIEEPDSGKFEDITFTVRMTGIGGALSGTGLEKLDTNVGVFVVGMDRLEIWND